MEKSKLYNLLKNPRGRDVAVIGEGISGRSANKLLELLGANATVLDERDGKSLAEDALLGFDFVVLSPGFPRSKQAIQMALKNQIPVVNEIDLAYPHLASCRFVGVTGTNGKSTTVAMIGEVLRSIDGNAVIGGNFGKPLCDAIIHEENPSLGVIELSSYQLETLALLGLDVALVTNLSPDHLDRYSSEESYYQTKAKIFELLNPEGVGFINVEDAISKKYLSFKEAKGFNENPPFSLPHLVGRHMKENVAAAYWACKALGFGDAQIEKALKEFRGIPHRLERLGEIGGVDWYNDSKATNVESAIAAVKSFDSGIHLILGGQGKGHSYDSLVDACESRVKKIYAIGADAQKIKESVDGRLPISCMDNLDKAIHDAYQNAKKGDVILLAPACASFDQYPNYLARGEHLRNLFIAHGGRSDKK